VLEFYVERDIHPEKWYPPEADGTVRKYDDLPPRYHANVNIEPPFDRHVGDEPRLSGEEIDDIIAFLQTLTDGYPSGGGEAASPLSPGRPRARPIGSRVLGPPQRRRRRDRRVRRAAPPDHLVADSRIPRSVAGHFNPSLSTALRWRR
jgi:hypothetical protein